MKGDYKKYELINEEGQNNWDNEEEEDETAPRGSELAFSYQPQITQDAYQKNQLGNGEDSDEAEGDNIKYYKRSDETMKFSQSLYVSQTQGNKNQQMDQKT